jgi:antitoxin component YwqK of YwqJK toxin-antitoxin module
MIRIKPTPHTLAGASICAAALLALACPAAHAVQDCEFNGKHINTSNGAETAGKTGMVRCKERDTGLLVREYELRDGQSVGLSRYYRDGKLAKEFTITANGPHEGLEREWAANGQLVLEFTNVNGRTRGLRRQWFEDGKPRTVEWVAENQSGGEREGAAVEYRANGRLASLRCGPKPLLAPHVNDAKLCGFENNNAPSTVNLYSSKGDVRSTLVLVAGVEQKATTFFDNGKPQAKQELLQQGTQKRETFYVEDGPKRREKLWDVSARPALLLRDAEFHTSGTLVVERTYQLVDANGRKRSRLALEARYYLNGQPQQKDTYIPDGDTELRDTQYYTDQGKLRLQGRYAVLGRYNERPVGLHQVFFVSGKLEREDTFDAKGKPTRQKVWDDSGTLLSDDEVFEDGSRKAYSK